MNWNVLTHLHMWHLETGLYPYWETLKFQLGKIVKISPARWILVVSSYFQYLFYLNKTDMSYACSLFFWDLELVFLSLLFFWFSPCYEIKWPCCLWCDWVPDKGSLWQAPAMCSFPFGKQSAELRRCKSRDF